MEVYDVIIIGAGLSGLAAGIRLSQYGKRVRILERQRYAGGLNSYYFRNGRCCDVGLHAMTNLARQGEHSAPLNTLLRQLRIRREELELCPQKRSRVKFPDATLCFDNDFETMRGSVRDAFPKSADGFDRLVKMIAEDDSFNPSLGYLSARKILDEMIPDELLREMLLCPMMFYGSSWLDDMDFHQFCVMFRSIFFEGLCRPANGMGPFVQVFLRRLAENGVELSLGKSVRSIHLRNGLVASVEMGDGEEIGAKSFVSCAGYPETMKLLSSPLVKQPATGGLAYSETLFELDAPAISFGMDDSILFVNDSQQFRYHPPLGCAVDMGSHLLCAPGNFTGVHEEEGVFVLRMSHLANYGYWKELDRPSYETEKEAVMASQRALLERTYPAIGAHITRSEMITPLTLERYTGRLGGAIYGSPEKRKDCRTMIPNLYVCGTDQGFLGIVGSLLSGVVVSNRYLIR
ncbi:MAG: NAD(P)/FAD-dependent oxidoreductase [Victivallales bacterium]|nr:NAD(P)/FAD-dependent oxidoreductase [Victivallales bacterium]